MNKNETDLYNSMYECQKHHAEQKKPDTADYTLYNHICIRFKNRQS